LAEEMERLAVYADAQERKASQLQSALDSRVAIEQANGMLAERFDLQFVEAFRVAALSGAHESQGGQGDRGGAPGLSPDAHGDRRRTSVRPRQERRPALRSMRGGRAD
jgi:hypothetical protein